MENIQPGIAGEEEVIVTGDLTARHLGSGGIDVFATPAMIALMEAAAVSAIDHLLDDGQASVGTAISIKHLAATPMGQRVRARAEVVAVDRRKVSFSVQAWDSHELIGEGSHTRFVIDTGPFIQKVMGKQQD